MATASPELQRRIIESFAATGSREQTARDLGIDRKTVRRYVNAGRDVPAAEPVGIPRAKHERAVVDGVEFPASVLAEYGPHVLNGTGTWLVLGDVHVPWHDRATIEQAVAEAKRRNAVGVILNGDFLDSHEISAHDKDPRASRYVEEIETGKQLLKWLRGQLPRAEFVLKEGNHEDRLSRYIVQRAPALFGLEGVDLQSLLHLKDYGCSWVGGKRVIELGKLCVLHGHEYAGSGGVSPARWLFLRARYVSMCGHFHRTSEYRDRNVRMKYEAAWSVGCACYLHPAYRPLNNWNLGCAFVELGNDGGFHVDNRVMFNGKLT